MNISTVSPLGNDWQASSLRNSSALEGVSGTKSIQMAADAATHSASNSHNANNSNSGDTIDFSTEFPSLDAISRRVMETMQRVLEQMAREAAEREAERAAREEARREAQVAAQRAAQRAAQVEQLQQQSQAVQQRDLQVAAPILGTANTPGTGATDNRSRDKKQVGKHQQASLAASASIQSRAHTLAPPREMVQHIRQSIQKLSKAEALVLHQFKPAASAFIA